ncbi:unnamed protein product [Laminaria digitata]
MYQVPGTYFRWCFAAAGRASLVIAHLVPWEFVSCTCRCNSLSEALSQLQAEQDIAHQVRIYVLYIAQARKTLPHCSDPLFSCWGYAADVLRHQSWEHRRCCDPLKMCTHRTDNRFPLHDLDLSGQIYLLICMI